MKWHGAGNDFILMNHKELQNHSHEYLSNLAAKMCHRRFGIGADGLMIAYPSDIADAKMVYYNSDGSYAAMCGNGIRCFGAFCLETGIVQKNPFTVETGDGVKTLSANTEKGYQLTVNMGSSELSPEKIPSTLSEEAVKGTEISVEDETFMIHVLKVGVPHTVVQLGQRQFDDKEFIKYGSVIEKLPIFPERTNVNFVKWIDRNHLRVDTWERGAGLTLACGTGVCSSAYTFHRLGLVDLPVMVNVAGGELSIDIKEGQIEMTGPAEAIATGEFLL